MVNNTYNRYEGNLRPGEDLWVNPVTPSKIKHYISKSRPYKAAGMDQVQMKVLKNLPKKSDNTTVLYI